MASLDPEIIFGPKGPLSAKLPYFEFRPSQVEYAQFVEEALTTKQVALLEAQTGTGKTLAYLVPAIKSGKRVIISTGTKALQEQLYFKDIPLLRDKVGIDFRYVLMKGRANYLCLLKLERLVAEPLLPDEDSVEYFDEVRAWAAVTDTGDIAEAEVPDHLQLWKQLTISADACLGGKCRFYHQCFVFKLKQRAEESQLIIVNHHLFFADLSLQILSSVSIFPPYEVVIFDEAHQLADVATHNLSVGFSQRGFHELYQDLGKEMTVLRVKEKQDTSTAQDRLRRLAESLSALFAKFVTLPQKIRYDQNSMTRLAQDHGLVLDKMFGTTLEELLRFVDKTEDMPQLYRRLSVQQMALNMLLKGDDPAYVYWAERNDFREWNLQASPLDVSGILKKSLWPNLQGAVLTSATLFIDKKCDAIKEDLGIETALEKTLPYNFDYQSQACLYIPKKIPEPSHPSFAAAAAEEIRNLIEITEGGTFVLCTSFANLRSYEEALSDLDFPLLVQGKRSKQSLLKSFLKKRGSVLLATMSFWQGIDIQGDALVSVIIDKLPFAVPNDPYIEAKIQYLKSQGKNAFLDYQLPAAVMLLKQGLGRLIRTSVDYGLLAILDQRLLTKQYGQVFLRNLPPLPLYHDVQQLKTAFDERRTRYAEFH